MARNWGNYIKRNKTGMDCQLVTAVNINHFLTGRKINEEEYQNLSKEFHCVNGACIGIDKLYKRLKIEEVKKYFNYYEYERNPQLPAEALIWHKSYGHHSIAILGYEPRTKAFRVTNFYQVSNTQGWIFSEDLHMFMQSGDYSKRRRKWVIRTFGNAW